MLLPSFSRPVSDFSALKHAIMGDIQDIDDVDDFVNESEDEIIGFLCKEQDTCEDAGE